MLYHYSDSDGIYIVGIYSVQRSHKEMKVLVEDIICCDLSKCSLDDYEDTGDFSNDTIVIKPNQFDESFLDLAESGVSLYVIGN